MATVKGSALWASVTQPNTQFTPCWCIDVVVTEEQAKAIILESKGTNSRKPNASIGIKKNKLGEYIFKLKRDVNRSDDSGENDAPVVRDAANRDFEGLVGNGSIVKVQYSFFGWNNKFGSGVGADLKGVQVLNLVEYGEPDGEAFGDETKEVERVPTEPTEEFDEEDFDD